MPDVKALLAEAQKLTADTRVELQKLLTEVADLRSELGDIAEGGAPFAAVSTERRAGGVLPPASVGPGQAGESELSLEDLEPVKEDESQ